MTPPDGESKLTKALKSYHLNKARTTADLPHWLFTEEERRVSRSKITSSREDDRDHSEREIGEPRRKGLKAIYADVDASASSSNNSFKFHSERKTSRNQFDNVGAWNEDLAVGNHQSKATSRLQAMRDARRPNERRLEEADRDMDSLAMKEVPSSTRRVGLPRGPKQRLN